MASCASPWSKPNSKRNGSRNFTESAEVPHGVSLIESGFWDDTAKLPKVIFCNEDGGYLDRVNVTERHFFRCLQAAGLKRRHYHDLRHTFAPLLLTAGAPIAHVSEQMGHSSIELTVKRYGHLQPGANRKFINYLPGSKPATPAKLADEA